MKIQWCKKIVIAVALLGLPAAASAQAAASTNTDDSPLYFPKMDKNHDGAVSRSEVPKELRNLRVHFNAYDTDHDHRLSQGEYVSYLQNTGKAACSSNNFTSSKCANMPTMRGRLASPPIAPKRRVEVHAG
ncbi:MAG: EF-hand domain-containing protein [Rhodanobacter sp.]